MLDIYRAPNQDHWLYVVVANLGYSETLRLSLRSLSLSRLGFANKDPALTHLGREAYGKALRRLQCELRQPTVKANDGVLAAMRALSLYEVLFNRPHPARS